MVLVNKLETEHPDCPVCGLPSIEKTKNFGTTVYFVNCGRCGRYSISEEAAIASDTSELLRNNAPRISGLIRLVADMGGEPIRILSTNILDLASHPLVPDHDDINKKADLLLEAIRRKTTNFGDEVKLELHKSTSLAFAENVVELNALLNLLMEDGRVTFSGHNAAQGITITAKGWQYLKGSDKKIDAKKGFIAIKSDGSVDKQKDAIKRAIERNGCKAVYVKDEYFTEIIFDKALGEIKESGFVVVDLTGDNSNVLFEAGFACGLSRKVIFVCDKTKDGDAKFYGKHFKIYFYKSMEELEETLFQAIKAVIK